MVAYVVEQVDAVWLIAGPPLKSMDWMSPYVWDGAGQEAMDDDARGAQPAQL
jgi:hypothetical protein